MNAAQAHQALLIRAFETPIAAPWTTADADWASTEAARLEGEAASIESLIARRASLACERLAPRDASVAAALTATTATLVAWPWAVVAIAFGFGLALDAVGPSQRLNIVALPMLGVLLWNLVVYALLLVDRWQKDKPMRAAAWVQAQFARAADKRASRAATPALRRYLTDTAAASGPLHGHRITFVLHAGAAALAAGLLVSLYVRGLAFEYHAGWESTFLGAEGVHRLLSFVLWPASTLSGQPFPTAAELAGLRFSIGPGENAARWIHWLALTIALIVLLPRMALAGWALWRSHQLAHDFPLDLREPYFQRLMRVHDEVPIAVQVLPYSYRLSPALQPGLQAVLQRAFGTRVALNLADTLPAGSEDELPRWLPAIEGTATIRLPLFALTATPERETHGALLTALSRQGEGQRGAAAVEAPFDVLIDESTFRASSDATRLAQRHAAWQKLLSEMGRHALFVDLARPDLDAIDEPLSASKVQAPA